MSVKERSHQHYSILSLLMLWQMVNYSRARWNALHHFLAMRFAWCDARCISALLLCDITHTLLAWHDDHIGSFFSSFKQWSACLVQYLTATQNFQFNSSSNYGFYSSHPRDFSLRYTATTAAFSVMLHIQRWKCLFTFWTVLEQLQVFSEAEEMLV